MSREDFLKFREETQERSRKMTVEREAKRLIAQAEGSGISDMSMRTDPVGFLDTMWYAEHGLDSESIASRMYSSPELWARSGSIVVVDGGDPDTRMMVACSYAFRGMMVHAKSPDRQIVKVIRLAEILPILITYAADRLRLIDELKAYRVLCVGEFDPRVYPRDATEGNKAIDAIFVSRMAAKLPTVITLSSPVEKFEARTAFGKAFESILNSSHDETKGVWRMRVKPGLGSANGQG